MNLSHVPSYLADGIPLTNLNLLLENQIIRDPCFFSKLAMSIVFYLTQSWKGLFIYGKKDLVSQWNDAGVGNTRPEDLTKPTGSFGLGGTQVSTNL